MTELFYPRYCLTVRRQREILAACREGVLFLDARNPLWYGAVDPGVLNMADGSRCVLGQQHGGFLVGRHKLGLGYVEVVRLGFSRPEDTLRILGCRQTVDEYACLTWGRRREITRRRERDHDRAEGRTQRTRSPA